MNARLGGINAVPSNPFLDELKKLPFLILG